MTTKIRATPLTGDTTTLTVEPYSHDPGEYEGKKLRAWHGIYLIIKGPHDTFLTLDLDRRDAQNLMDELGGALARLPTASVVSLNSGRRSLKSDD